jgi:hypothetical protein
VYNLDFWKTFAKLIESPFDTFKQIIYSEQKNFIFFILIFASAKFVINARFTAMITLGDFQPTTELFVSYLVMFVCLTLTVLLFSVAFTFIGEKSGYSMRLKDNFAILSYTQILNAGSLFILFPLELVIFGDYLFSINPSPFTIKEPIAYFLFGVELIIVFWTMFLVFAALHTQLKNISSGILFSEIFFLMLVLLIILSSVIIFTL